MYTVRMAKEGHKKPYGHPNSHFQEHNGGRFCTTLNSCSRTKLKKGERERDRDRKGEGETSAVSSDRVTAHSTDLRDQ